MTIAPVVQSIEVRTPPARSFALFTAEMSRWWPLHRTPAPTRAVAIIVEPGVGGRWYERDADGTEYPWGSVLAWEPPSRFVLGWQLNGRFEFDPDLVTEVEITFTPTASGGTRVRIEHRQLERIGTDAPAYAQKVDGGWGERLADFHRYTEEQSA